jgi:hypothetical protein
LQRNVRRILFAPELNATRSEQARGVLSPPNQLAKALQCDKSKERNGVTHHSSLSQKKSVFDAAADAVCSNY